jgi:hypothetical protein
MARLNARLADGEEVTWPERKAIGQPLLTERFLA